MGEKSFKRRFLTFYSRQEGRCLGCGLIFLLLLIISLLILHLFRYEIEAWAYNQTINYYEDQFRQKKLPRTPETEELLKTFKELKQNLKKGKVERKKFWQAMAELQKILIKDTLNLEDLKKIEQILKEIPLKIQKEFFPPPPKNSKKT